MAEVLSEGFSIFFNKFGYFIALGVISLWPILILDLLPMFESAVSASYRIRWELFITFYFVQLIVHMLLGSFLGAAAAFATLEVLCERDVRIGDCLARGMAGVLPVFGVSLCTYFVAALAASYFYIQGLIELQYTPSFGIMLIFVGVVVQAIIMTWFWVAVPAIVFERRGVFAAIQSSIYLTRGARFKVFLLYLLYVTSHTVLYIFAQAYGFLLGLAVQVVMLTLYCTLYSVAYCQLRRDKEGISARDIANATG